MRNVISHVKESVDENTPDTNDIAITRARLRKRLLKVAGWSLVTLVLAMSTIKIRTMACELIHAHYTEKQKASNWDARMRAMQIATQHTASLQTNTQQMP